MRDDQLGRARRVQQRIPVHVVQHAAHRPIHRVGRINIDRLQRCAVVEGHIAAGRDPDQFGQGRGQVDNLQRGAAHECQCIHRCRALGQAHGLQCRGPSEDAIAFTGQHQRSSAALLVIDRLDAGVPEDALGQSHNFLRDGEHLACRRNSKQVPLGIIQSAERRAEARVPFLDQDLLQRGCRTQQFQNVIRSHTGGDREGSLTDREEDDPALVRRI